MLIFEARKRLRAFIRARILRNNDSSTRIVPNSDSSTSTHPSAPSPNKVKLPPEILERILVEAIAQSVHEVLTASESRFYTDLSRRRQLPRGPKVDMEFRTILKLIHVNHHFLEIVKQVLIKIFPENHSQHTTYAGQSGVSPLLCPNF